jgi:hypothetical protein
MSFAAITLCVAYQRVFIVVVYFAIDSVRELLDTPSNMTDISTKYEINISLWVRKEKLESISNKAEAVVALFLYLSVCYFLKKGTLVQTL